MKPIAIWFHAMLGENSHQSSIANELIAALVYSGLAPNATDIEIGVNGTMANVFNVGLLIPNKTNIILHPPGYRSELPTFLALQKWLPSHPDWYVCYLHTKGATRDDALRPEWRRCMTRHVIWNWTRCVADLEAGCDAVGCHWLTPERFGKALLPTITPYFGGNFYWAKASFLLTLPQLKDDDASRADFYLPERWIGEGPRRPVVRYYHPEWPSMRCATT